jgi:hypothetical protein
MTTMAPKAPPTNIPDLSMRVFNPGFLSKRIPIH